MKIVIFGKDGMIGMELVRVLSNECSLLAFGSEVDISDVDAMESIFKEFNPEIVINAAAYNSVDGAENEKKLAYSVNATAPQNIALLSNKYNFKMVHYSTNFVFDGQNKLPYYEKNNCNPINFYGYTKLCGDQFVSQLARNYLIIRTSWVFSNYKDNFLKWAYQNTNNAVLNIVEDQIANPTYSIDIAKFTVHAIKNELNGVVNFTNFGACSKFEMIQYLVSRLKGSSAVKPVSSDFFNNTASRPSNGSLNLFYATEVLDYQVPTWQDAIERFIVNERTCI